MGRGSAVSKDGALLVRVYGGGGVILIAWNSVENAPNPAPPHHFLLERSQAPQDSSVSMTEGRPLFRYHWADYACLHSIAYSYTVKAFAQDGSLLRSATVTMTLADPFTLTHGVFFNRGCSGSQAYEKNFPPQTSPLVPAKRSQEPERWKWLSRGLEEAMLRFVDQAVGETDSLYVAAYELTHIPLLERLKQKIEEGVVVGIIYDQKDKQEHTAEAEDVIVSLDFPRGNLIPRKANPSSISHNKFIVWCRNEKPLAVWTGSTNYTAGGIFGQANVGHIVRLPEVAALYLAYWKEMQWDPQLKDFKLKVGQLSPLPVELEPVCCHAVFSPRNTEALLHLQAALLDRASSCSLFTAAFGIHEIFESVMLKNQTNAMRYVLAESKKALHGLRATRQPVANFVNDINNNNNNNNNSNKDTVIQKTTLSKLRSAYGAVLEKPTKGKVVERVTGLNDHVFFVHTKFLVVDAFSADPIVVTGSGNFSKASVMSNDENQLIIRGDIEVADAYSLEFWRLFEHFRFRASTKDEDVHHDWMADVDVRNLLCPLKDLSPVSRETIKVETGGVMTAMMEWQAANPIVKSSNAGFVTVNDDGSYTVSFSYDKRLVEELKTAIPSHLRIWDKDQKVWRVEAAGMAEVMAFVKKNNLGFQGKK